MATGGGSRFSVKRFGYDVLSLTLSTLGFPGTHLIVPIEGENNYPNLNDVLTVHVGVMVIAFKSRDKWKIEFEIEERKTDERGSSLSDMREIERFLSMLEESPEFRLEGKSVKKTEAKAPMLDKSAEFQSSGELDSSSNLYEFDEPPECQKTPYIEKIRKSLALYSELILFLHFRKIEVDFERFLDLWCRYFHEKIAVNEDADQLLMSMFIEDLEVENYLTVLKFFIRDVAVAYGEVNGASMLFEEFTQELHNFGSEIVTKPKLETIVEVEEVEEAVMFFDGVLQPRALEGDGEHGPHEGQEHPQKFPLPPSNVREVERRLEQMDLGDNEETTQESEMT